MLTVQDIIAKTKGVVTEYNKQGKVTGYNVSYDLYLVYEDGTEELLSAGASTNLGASGNAKVVDVEHNGQTFKVSVTK